MATSRSIISLFKKIVFTYLLFKFYFWTLSSSLLSFVVPQTVFTSGNVLDFGNPKNAIARILTMTNGCENAHITHDSCILHHSFSFKWTGCWMYSTAIHLNNLAVECIHASILIWHLCVYVCIDNLACPRLTLSPWERKWLSFIMKTDNSHCPITTRHKLCVCVCTHTYVCRCYVIERNDGSTHNCVFCNFSSKSSRDKQL